MPLFARTFSELSADTVEDLALNTNITRLSPGAKARALLDAANKRFEEQYTRFDLNLARAFVSSAGGQFLDLIASVLGVTRLPTQSASVTSTLQNIKFYVDSGTFGDINGGNDIPIVAGSIVSSQSNNTGVLYRVTAPAIAYAGANVAWVSAECIYPGEEGNIGTGTLIYHDVTDYTDSANSTLLVSNVHPIANGKNFESDENFRYRIVNAKLEAEAGNETAVRLAALSAGGVADVILIKHYRGIGTFGVIIQSIAPVVSDSLLDEVTILVNEVTSAGERAYVKKVKETGLTLKITVVYRRKLSEEELDLTETALEDLIVEEVNGLDRGESFSVDSLVARMFEAGDDIVGFGTSSQRIDEMFIYQETRLGDNKIRSKLLGDYTPDYDERVIVEPSVTNPITLLRKYETSSI